METKTENTKTEIADMLESIDALGKSLFSVHLEIKLKRTMIDCLGDCLSECYNTNRATAGILSSLYNRKNDAIAHCDGLIKLQRSLLSQLDECAVHLRELIATKQGE